MENRSLVLERTNTINLPTASLPSDIGIRRYQIGDEAVWTHLWRESEPFDTISDTQFRNSLGHDDSLLAERVYFVYNEKTEETIGTVTAWSQNGEGKYKRYAGWGRIHWLAVQPAYQGKGIGKALLIIALKALEDLGHDKIFLVTSSGRNAALTLYDRFGFIEADTEQSG